MRWSPIFLCAAVACGGDKSQTVLDGTNGVDSGTDLRPSEDTAGDSGLFDELSYVIESIAKTEIIGLDGVGGAVTHPSHGTTFVRDNDGLNIRTITHTWVHSYGTYCLGGSFDETGACRGGIERESGLLSSPNPTVNWCVDPASQTLILVKENGTRMEVVDAGKTGPKPYTYNQVLGVRSLPPALSASGSYTGPCVAIGSERAVVLSSAEHRALAVVSADDGTFIRKRLLEFEVMGLAIQGDVILALDGTHNRVVRLRTHDLQILDAVDLGPTEIDAAMAMAVGTGARVAWLTMKSGGVSQLKMGADGHGERVDFRFDGTAKAVVADGRRGLAWVSVVQDGVWSLVLLNGSGVLDVQSIEAPILALGEPNGRGDVAVYLDNPDLGTDGGVDVWVFGPLPDAETNSDPLSDTPLFGFLFTTIEEPSSFNMDIPCVGGDIDFARELRLVRNNAAIVAGLGVPVALGITDNFAQKAEECGETAIFDEMADHGFTMGVLLHNRPCFHCTDGGHDSNPVHCNRDSPHWVAAASSTACFPDDPDYCALGDWDCYQEFMTPQVDLVDRNIRGGGQFISGADRHRMWDHDWIRLYQEVVRPSVGNTGFDLSMFASAWAYDEVQFGDVRGKDLAPWALEDKTAAWHLGDIENWTQDAPRSKLLYMPGLSWSTVKISEQQLSGLYMIDFFSSGAPIAYQAADHDAVFQDLRTAIANRRLGALNTWYFHIHDLGTLNLRDVNNDPFMSDPDGEDGPEEPIATETLLRDFIDTVNAHYGDSSAFEWAHPREIRAMID